MKYKTNKLRRLEVKRTSIFTDDLLHCYFYDDCMCNREDLHEILYGRNRNNSMKYGFVLPLCRKHHRMFHDNHKLTEQWSAKCQTYYEQNHSRDEWISTFHRNYIN